MSAQLEPAASHCRHWKLELVPPGVQVPPAAVGALPTGAGPEGGGRAVWAGVGGVLGNGLVVALGGGFANANRAAGVARDQCVGAGGGAADAGGGGAAGVALQPLVGGAGAGGRPVAAGGGERLADVGVAGDAR